MFKLIHTIGLVLTSIVMLLSLGVFANANLFHYSAYMDSDIAGDVLLAEVLQQNGFRTPDTWVGSTTPRVISTPNIAAPIYALCGNLNLSMGIACIILSLLMLLSVAFFTRQAGLSWHATVMSLCLVCVLGGYIHEVLGMLFLYAVYYASHIAVVFMSFGIYAILLKETDTRKYCVWTAISVVLAVLAGMEGMHIVLFAYIPLFCTELLRQFVRIVFDRRCSDRSTPGDRMNWIPMLWSFVLLLITYIVVKRTASGLGETSRNIRHSLEKFLQVVLPQTSENIAWDRSFVWNMILILLALAGYLLLLVQKGRASKENERTRIMFWPVLAVNMSLLVMIAAATFTTFDTTPRYFVMVIFVLALGVALMYDLWNTTWPLKWSWIVFIPVLAFGVISIRADYSMLITSDQSGSSDETMAAAWLDEQGIMQGYSTFDFANAITVSGGNTVHVRALDNLHEMESCKWLSDQTWYPPLRSDKNPVAYIVTPAREEDFALFREEQNPEILQEETIGKYHIYIVDRDYSFWHE